MASPGSIALEERLAEAPEEIRRGHPFLGVLDADAEHLLGLLHLAQVRRTRCRGGRAPSAMSARASVASICPSGVRRKIASGAGQLPRSWTTLAQSLCSAAASASVTFDRSMALREPLASAIELLADEGANAEAEGVEVVRLLDAVVQDDELRRRRRRRRRACAASSRRAAPGAGSGRRCRAGWPRCRSRGLGSGAGRSSSTRSAPTRRRRKSASVRRCGSRPPSVSPTPTTKSTSDSSGLRRSTVSAVMRAPTMIEKAKKRSPMISQSAWNEPIPSPMRSNQPSVRTASSSNSRGFWARIVNDAVDRELAGRRAPFTRFVGGRRSRPVNAHGPDAAALAALRRRAATGIAGACPCGRGRSRT